MNPISAGRNIMEEVELNDLLSRCRPQCFSECDTITSCFCHSVPRLCLDWCHNCAVRILLPPAPSPRTPKQTVTTHGLSPRHNGAFFSHNAVAKVCKVTAADVTLRARPAQRHAGRVRAADSSPSARSCRGAWHHNSQQPWLDVMVKRNIVRDGTNGAEMASILNQSRLRGELSVTKRDSPQLDSSGWRTNKLCDRY